METAKDLLLKDALEVAISSEKKLIRCKIIIIILAILVVVKK